MKKIKLVSVFHACAVGLVAALAFCGCGDGGAATSRAGFVPSAPKGASLALGVNLNKEQAYRIVDTYAARILESLGGDSEKSAEILAKIEEYKKDPFKDAPKDVCSFMDESGLRTADCSWAVLTLDGPITAPGKDINIGGVAWAVAVDADPERLIAALRSQDKDIYSYEEVTVAEEKAWRIASNRASKRIKLGRVEVEPYIASLDGKLLLLAMSRETMEKQIRLYRKGEGGDALGDFTAANGDFVRLHLDGVGGLIRDNVRDRDLRPVTKTLPNAPEILKALKCIDIDIKAAPDGSAKQTICLEAASEEDAEKIRTTLNGLLAMLKLQLAKHDDVPKAVQENIATIKVEGSEGKVVIRDGEIVMSVLGGAVLPAIRSAMLSAQTSAMSMKGRNLFVGIIQANIDRETHGLDAVWPRTVAEAGGSENNISSKMFKSAGEYFAELFDVTNYGTEDWAPYVDCDPAFLGKDFVKGQTVNIGGLDWCVAANVTDDMPDIIPVLVSANFNPEFLIAKWDGSTDGKEQLPIGPASGAAKSMFGDTAIVVIYKGGAAAVFKSKYLNYDSIYMRTAFDLTNAKRPLMYLTPNGLAAPNGGK